MYWFNDVRQRMPPKRQALFAPHMWHIVFSNVRIFALFQCPTLKLKFNLPVRPLRVHIGVLKSANAATIMTYGIAHQRAIMNAYNAYVQRRRTSVTSLGQLSTIVAFGLIMDCHDVSAEMCHKRTSQTILKVLVARSEPVQLAIFFFGLTRTLQ